MCWSEDFKILVAYSRILPLNVSYEGYVSMGRVVVHQNYRKKGIGKELVTRTLEEMAKIFGKTQNIRLGDEHDIF